MATLEQFLQPITSDNPCGQDLDAEGGLFELDALLKGEAATDYTEAQEPDWTKVREKTLELLQRTHHIKLLVVLCLVQLKFNGLAGFRNGLALLLGLLEKQWDALYPRLDAEDKDPTQRVHLIRSLAVPLGVDSPYRFVKWLRQMPLTDSTRIGRFSFEDILNAEKPPGDAASSGRKIPTPAQVVAGFSDTKPEILQTTASTIAGIQNLLRDVNRVLIEKVGETNWPGLEVLESTVQEMAECVARYTGPGDVRKSGIGDSRVSEGSTVSHQVESDGVGRIQSREDVASALDKICEYYQRCEPASPVPFLLRRAKRLVHLDFMQSLSELAPSSIDSLKTVFGPTEQK